MDKNQKYVITINRELGSGGRTVGRILSEKLGVPFYDKALINELKAKYNLTTNEIEKLKGSKTNWWREFINTAMYLGQGMNEVWYYDRMAGQETHLVTSSEMFEVEKEILKISKLNMNIKVIGKLVKKMEGGYWNFLIKQDMKVNLKMIYMMEQV